jgi:hypothetical protein
VLTSAGRAARITGLIDADAQGRDHHDGNHGHGSHGVTDGDGTISPDRLREALHALSSDDRDERRPWAGAPAVWWREGALPPETARTVGTVLSWCAMTDDDAGGVRAELLASLAVLAEAGQVAEADLDRLMTGFDAQWIPENERASAETLRTALGRAGSGHRDRKGYVWTLVDHVHALTSPDASRREAAVGAAAAEPGLLPADKDALAVVSGWATA